MKFTLFLAFVSLSVLTSAKLDYGHKGPHGHEDPSHHDCGNGTTNPGNATLPGNSSLPIPSPTALPGNGTAPDNTTLPVNTTGSGVPPADSTNPATKRKVLARAGHPVKDPYGPDCGNGTTNPGNVTIPGNSTLPIPGNTTLPSTTGSAIPPADPTNPVTKREIGGPVKDPFHHHHDCGNGTTNPGNVTLPGNSTLPIPVPTTLPYNGTAPGNTTLPVNATGSGVPPADSTNPSTKREVVARAGGWVQKPSGGASFTAYGGCQAASCGQTVNGYSAAVNELAFGANSAAGGACGRCFKITPTSDPYSPSFTGPFGNTIVVKVNDLCPVAGNSVWCGQTVSHPLNSFKEPMHFDLCTDSGAAAAFFPANREAMLGTYQEVSCSEWSGSDGKVLWNGSCLAGETASLWPAAGGCPNTGTPPA